MIKIEIPLGITIDRACEFAATAVRGKGEACEFEFNGVLIQVHDGYTADFILERCYREHAKLREVAVGKFQNDLRFAITKALQNIKADADHHDIDNMLAAIKPFIREL